MGTDLSFIKLIADASMVVQLVILILLFISVSSWALIFQRRSTLKKSRSDLAKFNQIYQFLVKIPNLSRFSIYA